MENKKYKLTEEIIVHKGKTLYRIQALRHIIVSHNQDFILLVKQGDLGGYIQSEHNLSHKGSCWVYDNAKIHEYANVYGDAKIKDNAEVYGFAVISDNAIINGSAEIFENAQVFHNARIYDNAKIYGCAHVWDHATVRGKEEIGGTVQRFS